MSHPFYGKEFTFTQPHGAQLKVRGWGDQNSARFKDLSGRPVTRNLQTGFYETIVSEGESMEAEGAAGTPPLARSVGSILTGKTRWQERREEARRRIGEESAESSGPLLAPPQRQSVGIFVGLCLPTRFLDIGTSITTTQIDAFCNTPNHSGFSNNGSVRDYFLSNSLGKCDYSTVVAPLYTAKHNRNYYTDPNIEYGVRAQELIQEALAHHMSNGFDFSRLTTDNQDYVYAVNVFYAGDVVNNWSEGLWPHAHYLAQPVELAPSMVAHDYQITALGSELTLGTYCHENGHMLCDFPDLYDYDSDSAGVGNFCLMAGGSLADERNPVQIGAYLKYKAGWAGSLTELTAGLATKAAATGNHFFIHKKTPSEYFIVENRNRTGRDTALPDVGIAIWHVDELGNNSYQQGTATKHYECALIQADGKNDLEKNRNAGDAGDLFSDGAIFSGKWWDGSVTGLALQASGAPGASIDLTVNVAGA